MQMSIFVQRACVKQFVGDFLSEWTAGLDLGNHRAHDLVFLPQDFNPCRRSGIQESWNRPTTEEPLGDLLMKATRVFLLSSILALAVLGTASAEITNKSFDVGDGGKLYVDTDVGSIEVRSGGSGVSIEVDASGPRADELELDFQQNGNDVTVRGDFPKSSLWSWGRSPKIEFTITVPRRYDVELKTSGGSISVEDLEGEVRAKTSGGSLRFGNVTGSVHGRTSGGSISLSGSIGDADVETSGGSIKIGGVDGEVRAHTSGGSISIDRARGTVDAHTSGGSIKVDEVMGAIDASTSGGSVVAYISEQPGADCRLTTSGGGVTVYLADGIGVELDAQSSGGQVRSDFEVSGGRETKTSLSGAIHGGGPELYLRSSGGGVKIERK
jgi:DUF4097 and DUF4098 domain-containing protein YvlB